MLGFVNQNGITGAYDATTGVLTLIGVSSLANYQAALRSVTYANTSDNPSDAARTISFQVDDGGGLVSLGDAAVTFTAVNDAPVNACRLPTTSRPTPTRRSRALDRGCRRRCRHVHHDAVGRAWHADGRAGGGATVEGSGTRQRDATGTLAQINAALAAGNVVYRGAQDFFGDDTLTLTTDDGGNTGTGGALIDSDQVTIHVNTWLTGTPSDDSFTALPGNERIDALGGIDTITFDFSLIDATITWRGNQVIIDGPTSHTVLTGFETYVFTDGTVRQQRRRSAGRRPVLLFAESRRVERACRCRRALSRVRLARGARSERVLLDHDSISRSIRT